MKKEGKKQRSRTRLACLWRPTESVCRLINIRVISSDLISRQHASAAERAFNPWESMWKHALQKLTLVLTSSLGERDPISTGTNKRSLLLLLLLNKSCQIHSDCHFMYSKTRDAGFFWKNNSERLLWCAEGCRRACGCMPTYCLALFTASESRWF